MLPLADFIFDLRRRRRSYAEIREALRTEYGLIVARSTIHSFVKTRQKLLRRDAEADYVAPRRSTATASAPARNASYAPSWDAIEALKRKLVVVEPAKRLFVYDETKPLTLLPNTSS